MSTSFPVTTESRTGGSGSPTGHELRANLRRADPGVLVAVLAQLTGDPAVVDRFAPKITHVPDPPERAGVTDPETAAQLIEEIVAALRAPRPADAVPADDPDLFARVAPVALGGEIGPEYLQLLLEQGGFQPSQPVLPRTAKLPNDFRVVIIGAGIAGITAALACVDAGIEYQIISATPRSAAPGTPPPIPASVWIRRRRTTRCRAISTATGRVTTRRVRSIRPTWCRWRTRTTYGRTPGSAPRCKRCGGKNVDSGGRSTRSARTAPRRQLRQRGHPSRRISQSAALAGSTGPRDVFGDFRSFRAVGSRAGSDGQARRDHRSWLYRSADRRRMRGPGCAPHGVPTPAALGRAATARDRRCSRLPAVAGHPTAVLRELGSAEVVLGDIGQQLSGDPA